MLKISKQLSIIYFNISSFCCSHSNCLLLYHLEFLKQMQRSDKLKCNYENLFISILILYTVFLQINIWDKCYSTQLRHRVFLN